MEQGNLYSLLFDSVSIVSCDTGQSQLARFSRMLRWSSALGCVIQACDEQMKAPVRSQCVTKPSLFITAILSADWKGGMPMSNVAGLPYVENTIIAVATREPKAWIGETPRCERLRIVGVGVPATMLADLGLSDDFDAFFDDRGAPVGIKSMQMPAQIRALAEQMLEPASHSGVGRLLAEANAIEMVARTLAAFSDSDLSCLRQRDRVAVRRVRDLVEADLSYNWTLGELAQQAGLSTRSLNAKFRAEFGAPVFEYLRDRRLQFAHEVLSQRRMSVSETAYRVGYESPANFSTAFRRRFGYVPKSLLVRR